MPSPSITARPHRRSAHPPRPLERLHMAVRDGDLARIDAALTDGADINGINNANGVSPLVRAAVHDQTAAAQHLLTKGALPDQSPPGPSHDQPLHVAARRGNLPLVMLLVTAGAALESTARIRKTPLHEASENGRTAVVEWLLAQKANAHAVTEQGKTPLHQALATRNLGTARILIDHGVDPNHAPTSGGESPMDWARRKGHHPLVAQVEGMLLRNVLHNAIRDRDLPPDARPRVRL